MSVGRGDLKKVVWAMWAKTTLTAATTEVPSHSKISRKRTNYQILTWKKWEGRGGSQPFLAPTPQNRYIPKWKKLNSNCKARVCQFQGPMGVTRGGGAWPPPTSISPALPAAIQRGWAKDNPENTCPVAGKACHNQRPGIEGQRDHIVRQNKKARALATTNGPYGLNKKRDSDSYKHGSLNLHPKDTANP